MRGHGFLQSGQFVLFTTTEIKTKHANLTDPWMAVRFHQSKIRRTVEIFAGTESNRNSERETRTVNIY